MIRHVVAEVEDIPPGTRKRVMVDGRPIVIFNLDGTFHGLLDRCPHEGAALSAGRISGIVRSDGPGHYELARPGQMIKCPWHGWEFDIRTGQSWCDPGRMRARKIEVKAEEGARLVEGPYKAETVEVNVDGAFVVVEI